MNRSDFTPQHLVERTLRSIAAPMRTGRRSLALGAVLLLGSTITVLATANTPPTITNLSLSQAVINEGGSVTLSGSFTDPDAGDAHSALIFWPDGEKQKVEIPVGVTTFQATRTFPDNLSYHNVTVDLRDRQLPIGSNDNTEGLGKDTESVQITVNNVAPSFAHNVTVTKGRNQTPGKVIVEGDVVDPGADTVEVKANWDASGVGAISPGQACTMTAKRHFRCEHTYPVPAFGQSKTYSIKLAARDDDGGQHHITTSVQIP